MDESGSFYNMPPDSTIAQKKIEGAKKDKTRITIAFTCNADGTDRFEPFFIGHAEKPRCFNKKTGQELGFYYKSNKKAWMTGLLFQDYLRRFDRHVNRPVLLLIDNVPSHIDEGVQLQNVTIKPLPPNTTSKLQPLDAGIIATFKQLYRRRQVQWGLDQLDIGKNPYKVDQLQAMRWMKSVWSRLDQSVFVNCWNHTGLLEFHPSVMTPLATHPIAFTVPDVNIDPNMDFQQEFDLFIQQAGIREAMSIEEFFNPAAEDSYTQEELMDEEIIALVQNDESQTDPEEEEEVFSPYQCWSAKDKLTALAQTIAIIES